MPSQRSGRALMAKVALAAASIGAGAGLSLRATGIWHATRRQTISLVVIVAVIALWSSITSAVSEYRRVKAAEQQQRVTYILRAAAYTIADVTGIAVRQVGLSAYVIERKWHWIGPKVLRRLHRERAAFWPPPTAIEWRPGKGVIGLCVARERDFGRDVGADYSRWRDCTEAQWITDVPEDVKMGLNFEEFNLIKGKYGACVATPMVNLDPVKVVGCVAIDGPLESYDRLWQDDVRALLQGAAVGIVLLSR
jgi:hypothetical protein